MSVVMATWIDCGDHKGGLNFACFGRFRIHRVL